MNLGGRYLVWGFLSHDTWRLVSLSAVSLSLSLSFYFILFYFFFSPRNCISGRKETAVRRLDYQFWLWGKITGCPCSDLPRHLIIYKLLLIQWVECENSIYLIILVNKKHLEFIIVSLTYTYFIYSRYI